MTRTPECLPPLAFGSGLAAVALVIAAQGILGTLAAYIVTGATPEIVRGVYAVYAGIFTVSDLFLGMFLIAAALTVLPLRALPRWLGWIGLVGGMCLILGAFSFATPQSILGIIDLLGLVLFLLWILLTSIWMLRGQTSGGASSA